MTAPVIRRLQAYRRALDDLPAAVRAADAEKVDVSTIAREAGISRNRVYRILHVPSEPEPCGEAHEAR